ncbi:MAG: cell division protein FtsH, partial [Deltaproteobacteria bacterium CG_4_10_14_0_2_um_filter_43_8]
HKMVCEWGMSEKLGPLAFGKKEEQVFLGKEMGHQKNYSDTTAQVIDEEVHSIVRDGYDKAFKILTDNKKQLEDLAIALLEHESLDADQIDRVVKGEKLAADQKPVQRESNPEKKMNKPSKIRNLIPDPGKA